MKTFVLLTACAMAIATAPMASLQAEAKTPAQGSAKTGPDAMFQGQDLFDLAYATDPQISPDGSQIAYVRRTNDIMTDRAVSSIWLIDVASGDETPLVTGAGTHVSPRWSPDGERLAYISTQSGGGPDPRG